MTRHPVRTSAAFIAAVALMLAISCGGPPDDPPDGAARGVLVVTVDGLRADRLAIYGGDVEVGSLARLSRDGVRFDDLTTPTPMPRPAAVSVLTGLAPDAHGVQRDHTDSLSADRDSLPRTLRAAGWKTAAFVSTPLLSIGSGLEGHFEVFDGPEEVIVGPASFVPPNREAGELADHLTTWLATVPPDGDWLGWVHLGQAGTTACDGDPASAAETWAESVRALDETLGRLVELARTRSSGGAVDVVLVGTHGVMLDESDGACGNAFWLTDETLAVAGFRARYVDGAAVGGGTVDDRRRWLPDVHATLAEIAGVGVVPGTDGISFGDSSPSARRPLRRAWTWAPDDQFAWPPLTAVENSGSWRVFDSTELGEGAASDAIARTAAERPARSRSGELPDEQRARLAKLGLDLGPSRAFDDIPVETGVRNDMIRAITRIRHHFRESRERPAAKTSARVLSRHPEAFAPLIARIYLMVAARAIEPGEELVEVLLRRFPDRQDALHWSAHVEWVAGRTDRAYALLEATRSLGSVDADVLYDVACLKALAGDRAGALAGLRDAVAAGYRNWEWIERDADLASIRADPEYARILAEHRR